MDRKEIATAYLPYDKWCAECDADFVMQELRYLEKSLKAMEVNTGKITSALKFIQSFSPDTDKEMKNVFAMISKNQMINVAFRTHHRVAQTLLCRAKAVHEEGSTPFFIIMPNKEIISMYLSLNKDTTYLKNLVAVFGNMPVDSFEFEYADLRIVMDYPLRELGIPPYACIKVIRLGAPPGVQVHAVPSQVRLQAPAAQSAQAPPEPHAASQQQARPQSQPPGNAQIAILKEIDALGNRMKHVKRKKSAEQSGAQDANKKSK